MLGSGSIPPSPAALWWRRAAWLAADVARAARGLGRALARARRPDQQVAIGLLAGEPWATRGGSNRYRVRLVNDTPAPVDVELHLRGETDVGGDLVARGGHRLPAAQAVELYLVTDWVATFDVRPEVAVDDGLDFLAPSAGDARCRVTATLTSAGALADVLRLVQRLVG